MATGKNFIETIAQLNLNGEKLTMAELMAKVLKDKVVEIYIGDTYEDIKFDDSTQKCVSVLIGKIITAYAECIVLDCIYIDQIDKKPKTGNIVCLNERAIRTITEVDDSGVLKDTFLSTRDTKVVKSLFKK